MVINKNGKWIQTLHCLFCTPKPDEDLFMHVDLPLDANQKTVESQKSGLGCHGLLGHRPAYTKPKIFSYWNVLFKVIILFNVTENKRQNF